MRGGRLRRRPNAAESLAGRARYRPVNCDGDSWMMARFRSRLIPSSQLLGSGYAEVKMLYQGAETLLSGLVGCSFSIAAGYGFPIGRSPAL